MRAQLLVGHGDVDNYTFTETAKRPIVHEGEVLIRVGACGMNSVDICAREGVLSENAASGCHTLSFPCIQGSDVVGRIQEVGANVPRRRIGQRVVVYPVFSENGDDNSEYGILGIDRNGGFAEYVSVPSANCIEVPMECELDDVELASLITSGMTAYRMLILSKVAPGETVVITGASGGIGLALIQLCKSRGAKVIAVCAEEKKDEILKIGAAHVVARDSPDLSTALMECGRPIDCILDMVAGPMLADLFKAIKIKGRYCCGGAAAGPETPSLFWPMLCWKELEITGALLASKHEFYDLIELITKRALTPRIHQVFSLEELPEAQAFLKEKTFVGKLVVDCTVPDPIPKEGEFMLKCEEVPSCIEWADSGAMEVVRVTDTKVLAPSMIPEGATIAQGSRLVRVETARGTCLSDEATIQRRRGKALKSLFADKPTLFLVFQEGADPNERALSVASSASSSSAASQPVHHAHNEGAEQPRGRTRVAKLKLRKKKRSPSTDYAVEAKARKSKKTRGGEARLKLAKKRPQPSGSPKLRRPAPRLTVRTRPAAPPKKRRPSPSPENLREASASSPEPSESPVPKKRKRRAVSESPKEKRRLSAPGKKKRRVASQSPEQKVQKSRRHAASPPPEDKRTSVPHIKLKRRVLSESREHRRRPSPAKESRHSESPSPEPRRHMSARQYKQKHRAASPSLDRRQSRLVHQKRRTSKSLEPKDRGDRVQKQRRSKSSEKRRVVPVEKTKRAPSPAAAKKRYSSEASEEQPRPLSAAKKRYPSESPAEMRRSTAALQMRRRSPSPAESQHSSQNSQHIRRRSASPEKRRITRLPQMRRRSPSQTPKRRAIPPLQERRRVRESSANRRTSQSAQLKPRSPARDRELRREREVRRNSSRSRDRRSRERSSSSATKKLAQNAPDDVRSGKPGGEKRQVLRRNDGEVKLRPAGGGDDGDRGNKVRIIKKKPRVELSRRVAMQRTSRLSVDRMGGMIAFRRERSRSPKRRVTLVRRKEVSER